MDGGGIKRNSYGPVMVGERGAFEKYCKLFLGNNLKQLTIIKYNRLYVSLHCSSYMFPLIYDVLLSLDLFSITQLDSS